MVMHGRLVVGKEAALTGVVGSATRGVLVVRDEAAKWRSNLSTDECVRWNRKAEGLRLCSVLGPAPLGG